MTKPDPAKRREAAAQREVTALHNQVKRLANVLGESVEPSAVGKAGDLLLAVAKQKADNAGLAKRHVKVEATVSGVRNADDWLAGKMAEGDDDGE